MAANSAVSAGSALQSLADQPIVTILFNSGFTVFQIGPYTLASRVVLAPMAGVTDLPFRRLCRQFGAGLVVSEMVTSDTKLWHTNKSRLRLNHDDEIEPRSVQIAGSDPETMAVAAYLNVERGAQIIDINMGCPAKKVCKKAAGSALLKDPQLVTNIVEAVVQAVDVPVTLKIRTGWDTDNRNGVEIAQIAEHCGIAALAVHGRTKACKFNGTAEYETIKDIKAAVSIPVIANGDIDSPKKAMSVMQYTGADAVMIGRAAQGRPWLCREIAHFLEYGELTAPPSVEEIQHTLLQHIRELYTFYGDFMGVKIARKHVGWYVTSSHTNNIEKNPQSSAQTQAELFRKHFNTLETTQDQCRAIEGYFKQLSQYQTTSSNILNSGANNSEANINKEVIAA